MQTVATLIIYTMIIHIFLEVTLPPRYIHDNNASGFDRTHIISHIKAHKFTYIRYTVRVGAHTYNLVQW